MFKFLDELLLGDDLSPEDQKELKALLKDASNAWVAGKYIANANETERKARVAPIQGSSVALESQPCYGVHVLSGEAQRSETKGS